MAILDRSFVNMGDLLKPVFCATALLGVHLLRPFHRLVIDKKTTHETLLVAFPKLYTELQECDVQLLLGSDQVLKFVTPELFNETLPKMHLLTNLLNYSKEYRDEVIKILQICIDKFHRGFSLQKGAIYGFGTHKDDDTGSVLKIFSLADKSVLADAPVHNLGEERNVGMINYELNLRGREKFSTCSQYLVLNKSSDLIGGSYNDMKKFRKQAGDIKDLKLEWNQKMKQIEEQGLDKQEAASLTQESKKLQDLDFLKSQTPPGPFTSVEEVNECMANTTDPERNKRLRIEVRYAKSTTSHEENKQFVQAQEERQIVRF